MALEFKPYIGESAIVYKFKQPVPAGQPTPGVEPAPDAEFPSKLDAIGKQAVPALEAFPNGKGDALGDPPISNLGAEENSVHWKKRGNLLLGLDRHARRIVASGSSPLPSSVTDQLQGTPLTRDRSFNGWGGSHTTQATRDHVYSAFQDGRDELLTEEERHIVRTAFPSDRLPLTKEELVNATNISGDLVWKKLLAIVEVLGTGNSAQQTDDLTESANGGDCDNGYIDEATLLVNTDSGNGVMSSQRMLPAKSAHPERAKRLHGDTEVKERQLVRARQVVEMLLEDVELDSKIEEMPNSHRRIFLLRFGTRPLPTLGSIAKEVGLSLQCVVRRYDEGLAYLHTGSKEFFPPKSYKGRFLYSKHRGNVYEEDVVLWNKARSNGMIDMLLDDEREIFERRFTRKDGEYPTMLELAAEWQMTLRMETIFYRGLQRLRSQNASEAIRHIDPPPNLPVRSRRILQAWMSGLVFPDIARNESLSVSRVKKLFNQAWESWKTGIYEERRKYRYRDAVESLKSTRRNALTTIKSNVDQSNHTGDKSPEIVFSQKDAADN